MILNSAVVVDVTTNVAVDVAVNVMVNNVEINPLRR